MREDETEKGVRADFFVLFCFGFGEFTSFWVFFFSLGCVPHFTVPATATLLLRFGYSNHGPWSVYSLVE